MSAQVVQFLALGKGQTITLHYQGIDPNLVEDFTLANDGDPAVIAQIPEPGTMIAPGAVVTLVFPPT